jgi:hypothetical protein
MASAVSFGLLILPPAVRVGFITQQRAMTLYHPLQMNHSEQMWATRQIEDCGHSLRQLAVSRCAEKIQHQSLVDAATCSQPQNLPC